MPRNNLAPVAAAPRLGLGALLGAEHARYRTLLAEAGFSVERVIPTASPAGLSVVEATPAPPD